MIVIFQLGGHFPGQYLNENHLAKFDNGPATELPGLNLKAIIHPSITIDQSICSYV